MTSTDATSAWALTFDVWSPDQQPLREALCALGNGLFATRGAAEEESAGGPHYPGTYLAGGYNRRQSEVAGKTIENEDLVNWPNWLCLSFRVQGGDWLRVEEGALLDFHQRLDMRSGLLERRVRLRDRDGRQTALVARRLVHMGNPHLAAIEWTITPENWSGAVEICSALDGAVSNQGVERYRKLNSQHLELVEGGSLGDESVYLAVETNQSRIRMAQAARTRVFVGEALGEARRKTRQEGAAVEQRLFVEAPSGKALRVEKVVALHTSRDFAISEPILAAQEAVGQAGSFAELLDSHRRAWARLWHRADIEIGGADDWAQRVLRLHIFHLLQTTSFNSCDLDAGVPARGLHGEAYRGHIFWDELFIFPFLNLRMPELTRSLLMYRHRRLPAARRLAAAEGLAGAMYPWQSGSDGREESQVLHLNPKSGRWIPDNTHRQRHVNAAIALNVWNYFQATHDFEFLAFHGAEMLLEIARLWASLAEHNPDRGRFEIRNVVGPDEFHTDYPGGDGQGLNNNAYTNVMAAWTLWRARQVLDLVSNDRAAELIEDLRITEEELARWDEISRRMFVPFHDDGIISQFEGYERLEEFDWEGYRAKHGDIHRLDRILEAEGDDINRYKASKQADTLMLFYLFSAEELGEIFGRLGYDFDSGTIPRNIDYYLHRTSHGSTLSRVVHSWVLARSDRQRAWDLFRDALASDISDIQGGTTSEGIHLGAMAGTVDLVQRCYTGLELRKDALWLNPCLPDNISEMRLRIQYRGHWLRLHVTHQRLAVTFEHGWSNGVKIGFGDRVYEFSEGQERVFDL